MKKIPLFFFVVCIMLVMAEIAYPFDITGHWIDTTIVPLNSHQRSYQASLASHGNRCLFVWCGAPSSDIIFDVFGRFVDSTGCPVDSSIIRICIDEGWQHNPKVAYGDGRYCVVWEQGLSPNVDLYYTFIDTLGSVTDTIGRPLVTMPAGQWYPAIAYCDSVFLVVWEDRRSNDHSDIYGGRIDWYGNVLDPQGFVICAAPNWQEYPVVAASRHLFVSAWSDFRDNVNFQIYFAAITPDGSVSASKPLSGTAGRAIYPAIASNESNFMVGCSDNSYQRYVTSRIDTLGNLVDSIPHCVCQRQVEHSVCCATNIMYYFFHDCFSSLIYTLAVRPDNTTAYNDSVVLAENADYGWGNAAAIENRILTAYRSWDSDPNEVRYSLIGSGGDTIFTDRSIISDTTIIASSQREPEACWGGDRFVVAWFGKEGVHPVYNIRCLAIDTAGYQLGGSYNTNSSKWNQSFQDIAGCPQGFTCVWCQDSANTRDVYGMFLDHEGVPVGDSFLVHEGNGFQQNPHVSFADDNYCIVWTELVTNSIYYTANQYPVMPSQVHLLDTGTIGHPQIAGLDDKFIVSYCLNDHLYVKRIDHYGSLIDTARIAINAQTPCYSTAEIAGGHGIWMITWLDPSTNHIVEVRVDTAGTVLDAVPIVLSGADIVLREPRVAFDGVHFIVCWQQQAPNGLYSVYGVIVNDSGAVVDWFTAQPSSPDIVFPCLASDGHGNAFVAWQAMAPLPYQNVRLIGAGFRDPAMGINSAEQRTSPCDNSVSHWPNPTHGRLRIRYSNSYTSHVAIKIYNCLGQLVKTVMDDKVNAGIHTIQWDGKDEQGQSVSSGVYFYSCLRSDAFQTNKFIVAR